MHKNMKFPNDIDSVNFDFMKAYNSNVIQRCLKKISK